MKAVFYVNNEDGTFKKLSLEKEVDAYSRPYKGDRVNSFYIIYDIEIKDDIIKSYVCMPDSDLLDGIEFFHIEVKWDDGGYKDFHISPDQYMEGKRCKTSSGTFTMGKILQKYPIKDRNKVFPEFGSTHGTSVICII